MGSTPEGMGCHLSSIFFFYLLYNLLLSFFYYIKLKSRLSVCPSDRHADISAMCALIETKLARNES